MPHRVVDFFRSPNDSINSIKQTVQRRASPTTSRSGSRERQRPTRNSSYASSADGEGAIEDGHPVPLFRSLESTKEKYKEQHKEHHRLSFPSLHLVGHKTQKDLSQNPSAALDWRIESAPAVFYGGPEESTGALISGQLQVWVKEESFEVENLDARLEIRVTQKKPFNSHCQDCATQKTELKSWSFLSEPTVLTQRTHEFPFSILLEGHLPATTDSHLLSIEYVFTAEARPRDGGLPLKLRRTIDVRRSLSVPPAPHHSVRIFPPTNITASVHYDAVVYPHATSSFNLRLEGIGKHNNNARSVEYWKLKRLSWKLEENVSTVAPACRKHTPKTTGTGAEVGENGGEPKKGATRTDTRIIAHADLHSGWKADYYSAEGSIEAEIEYQTGGSSSRPISCDVRGRDGTEVTHRLVVEMVVAQEYVPLAHTRHVTPTGVARILRMNFGVVITDRGGLGVSWDNEAPPIYQDVPPSPPSYVRAVIQNGSVEDLCLPSPSSINGEESPAYCGSPFTPEDLGSEEEPRLLP
ncbi:arrestin n-terminal domain-containing protein [Xylaria flabelliformis]|nr:arrestin n-terminal domain-containing protein [Xylaria flabelliformis]